MAENFQLFKQLQKQRGVTVIVVALLIIVFFAFAALAVDIFHIVVARNELHNAADAGALAGARFLYTEDGTAVNEGANQIAYDAATTNKSEKVAVDVFWEEGKNTGSDVERGHWSFATSTFTPNDSLIPADLWGKTNAELDQDTSLINAIRVRTRRETTPIASFFARILGYQNFILSSEAVAYIGYTGMIINVDQPIAICSSAITEEKDGSYTCSTGREITSEGYGTGSVEVHNTAAWTNFTPCQDGAQDMAETATPQTVLPLVCEGNSSPIPLGVGMGTTDAMEDIVFKQFRSCWLAAGLDIALPKDGIPDQPWEITLPVVCCGTYDPATRTCNDTLSVDNCMVVLGAVTVNVLWITETGSGNVTVPKKMWNPIKKTYWKCADTDTVCWDNFVIEFNLKNWNDDPANLEKKSIYFLPDCKPQMPQGNTGGQNFGILSRFPVLVK